MPGFIVARELSRSRSCLRASCCDSRVPTNWNEASFISEFRALLGYQRTLTLFIIEVENASALSAPSLAKVTANEPRSPRSTLLPNSSCSLMHELNCVTTAMISPLLYLLSCPAMCLAMAGKSSFSLTCATA